MFAKIENGAVVVYPYTEWHFRADHPNTSFPEDLTNFDPVDFGAVAVAETAKPTPGPKEQVVELTPVLVMGAWRQNWSVQPYAPPVPEAVTMRQARQALLSAGLLATVEAAFPQLPKSAQIDWECASEVRRDNALIGQMAQTLGLNSEQIDGLFRQAQTL